MSERDKHADLSSGSGVSADNMSGAEHHAAQLRCDIGGGHSFSVRIPDGDTHERHVCNDCGYVHYVNPKIVVGSVVTWHGADDGEPRILMCRRAIEPRHGFWTLPAGYMELGETAQAAAMREAREEACADIRIDALLAVYSIPRIGQVQLMYKATLLSPNVMAGDESLEVALVRNNEIPWDDLAFPSVRWALTQHRQIAQAPEFVPFSNPPGETGNMGHDAD